LRGMMLEHDMHPDEYLNYVHDLDLSGIPIDKRLGLEIRSTDRSICCLIQSTSHYVANMDI